MSEKTDAEEQNMIGETEQADAQTLTDHLRELTGEEEQKMVGEVEEFDTQTLTDHLRELRSCLIKSFLAVIAGFALSYGFIKPIGTLFFKPLIDVLPEGSSLIFTSYQEGFFFI